MAQSDPFPVFETTYAQLPAVLHSAVAPHGASAPKLLKLNEPLAEVLGFDIEALDKETAANIFSGNQIAPGTQPLAMAYAGHQFGGFNPGLGDGRALLLGEVRTTDGKRHDIQLKGSGQTPYSRQGDGRAALGPVLREYLVSEAMAALGVPTTRALAAIATGDPVLREGVLPGAMVTRVAASHLRVGTFELAAFRGERQTLDALVRYALQRHDPAGLEADYPALALLEGVIARQAKLVAQWMGIGFIHGVMNTDNCTISGETIDYGPCAFMDEYSPGKVFSSIDHQGRYAFANQPPIVHWNMAVLAQALLGLLGEDEKEAVSRAQGAVDAFPAVFQAAYREQMAGKLGLTEATDQDDALIQDLLHAMSEHKADFTTTFRSLCGASTDEPLRPLLGDASADWHARWTKRLTDQGDDPATVRGAMVLANPAIIPRNHRMEAMIAAALDGDFALFHALVDALATPYAAAPDTGEGALLAYPPAPEQVVHATFCGT